MKPNLYLQFTGRMDRRNPRSIGDPNKPVLRENILSRNGLLHDVRGTERAINDTLTDKPTWIERYYSVETGAVSPKTFVYTQDGKLWRISDRDKSAAMVTELLNENAYPKSWMFKTQTQTKMFLVDERHLWKHDGNNDDLWEKVNLVDVDGSPIYPIDVIEHKDRLWVISETYLHISKNLEPETFNDSTDSAALIVGSGKGKNLAIGKIEDNFYIFNTEGIFMVIGDLISAVASTFDIRLVDERKIIARRSLAKVEKALVFLADDYNIWSWDGNTSTKLSHDEALEGIPHNESALPLINTQRAMLDKAVATYEDNYYKLSVVKPGDWYNQLEIWWDSIENKIEFVTDRNVSAYMETDPTREDKRQQICSSEKNYILNCNQSYNFDGSAIRRRLRTKDITPAKGKNVRFDSFYLGIEGLTNRNMQFTYYLDGRLSVPTGVTTSFSQNLEGETKTLGAISIKNQSQFTARVRPKIKYSKGESIAFEIDDSTLNMRFRMIGMRIDFIAKSDKKFKTIGG